MGFATKTAVKSNFQDGDRPTQDNFDDAIDSILFIHTTATAEILTGIYDVISTASATGRSRTDIGLQIIGTDTPTEMRAILGLPAITTAGAALQEAASAAVALSALGIESFGRSVIQSTATSTAINLLGAGSAGVQVVSISATSQLANLISGTPSILHVAETTGTTLGTTQSFGTDFRRLVITLPSAATNIRNVEILLNATPVSADFSTVIPNLALQMRRRGISDFDAGSSDYRFNCTSIVRDQNEQIQTTANEASAMTIAFVGNTIGFNRDPAVGGVWSILRIEDFNNTARRTRATLHGTGFALSPTRPNAYHCYGVHNTAAAVDQIRIFFTQQMSARYMEARVYAQGI